MLRLLLAGALTLASLSAALAKDTGEFTHIPQDLRNKFFHDPTIQACCSEADGHPATWRASPEGYEVLIEGEWMHVPPNAVLHRKDNPTGDSIIWFGYRDGKPFIRCFIPAFEG